MLYRIVTGAPLPVGANTVCMVEDTQLEAADANGEEVSVRTLAAVPPGQHVRQPGSDVRAGDVVVSRGQVVSAAGGELGTLAFVGSRKAIVHRLPRVAILSTGDELVDVHANADAPAGTPSWGGIFDCNRPAIASVLHSHHFPTVDCGIVRDTRAATAAALRAAAAVSDVIVTTGGTSMGESDFLKPVIEQELGGTIHFGRVAMKPGKPTTFASIPAGDGRQVMIFGLPGNPASGLVTLQVFVLPALRKMAGFPPSSWHLPTVDVKVGGLPMMPPCWMLSVCAAGF